MIKKMKVIMLAVSVLFILLGTNASAHNKNHIISLNNKPQPTHLADKPNSKAPLQTALPPAYLSVKKFTHCLKLKKEGTSRFYCLPADRPPTCPEASWKKLSTDKLFDKHSC